MLSVLYLPLTEAEAAVAFVRTIIAQSGRFVFSFKVYDVNTPDEQVFS